MNVGPVVMALAMAGVGPFAVGPAAFAQQGAAPGARVAAAPPPAARLTLARGDVLASTDTGLVAVAQGAPLKVGTRVMTMARSTAQIEYADGCVVLMKSNERTQVKPDSPCEDRKILAQLGGPDPVPPIAPASSQPGLAGMALAGELPQAAGFAAGIAGAVWIIRGRIDDGTPTPVSPN